MSPNGQTLQCVGCGILYPVDAVRSVLPPEAHYSYGSSGSFSRDGLNESPLQEGFVAGYQGTQYQESVQSARSIDAAMSQSAGKQMPPQTQLPIGEQRMVSAAQTQVESETASQKSVEELASKKPSEEQTRSGPWDPASQGKTQLLQEWKTSYGFSVLGAVVLFLTCGTAAFGVIGIAIDIAWFIGSLIYALVIYPSFFSEKPKLHSSSTISFFNVLFGGIIFGCIWNSNLANGKKGGSNFVYVVLGLLIAMCIGLYSFLAIANSNPFNRIKVPGYTGEDITTSTEFWDSSPLFLEGEDQYEVVVNDYVCRALSQFTESPYDEIRKWWDNTKKLSEEIRLNEEQEKRKRAVLDFHRNPPSFDVVACSQSVSHIKAWQADFSYDGKEYIVQINHVYLHDRDSGESQHGYGVGSPWLIYIGESTE